MSTVKVIASQRTGKVLNVSTTNPDEAWIMVESSSVEYSGGRRFENKRNGFLRQQVSVLSGLQLEQEFAQLAAKGIDTSGIQVLQPKGFADGQVLPGRVVIQDSLVPIIADNVDFGLRVPQIGNTPEARNAVRNACNEAGLTYMQSGQSIYRKTYYSPYPEGHPKAEQDIILTPDNLDEVQAFIAKLNKPSAGMDNAKDARLKELQGNKTAVTA